MATLTQTAYMSRKIIKYGSIFLVTFLILRSIVISATTYWKKIHPPPPPPPTTAYGKLPKLAFPQKNGIPTLTIKLENVSGSLPKLTNMAKVFFMPKTSSNLLAWDNTKAWARSLGFLSDPEQVDEYNLRFSTNNAPKTTLNVNVLTKNFTLAYDWQNDLGILAEGNPPQQNEAATLAKSFLQGAGVLTEDLSAGRSEVTYFKYSEGNLVKVIFFSEANFAKVNIFRKDVEGLKVLPPDPKTANVNVTLSASKDKTRSVVETKYVFYPVSLINFTTYPLKDANTAWNQLKSGGGFVANLGNNSSGNITIRDVYLAYYDSSEEQSFLQPIIVFEGDNDFSAYIPAIADTWTEQ